MSLISSAFAQTAQTAAATQPNLGGMGGLIQIALIGLVFYFLLIRPHSKKMKEHNEMQSSIRRGDRIVTGGGIIAQVVKILGDHELLVEIADGVRIKILRDSIGDVIGKVKPVDSSSDNKKDEEETDAKDLKEALKKTKGKKKKSDKDDKDE
ncbi:MAG: preprotein translocase subunit YajC [Alphaproteobacteria bacterium]|nr:preprotein translocase subunit YajC [Alphaproteobacteria bacterium]